MRSKIVVVAPLLLSVIGVLAIVLLITRPLDPVMVEHRDVATRAIKTLVSQDFDTFALLLDAQVVLEANNQFLEYGSEPVMTYIRAWFGGSADQSTIERIVDFQVNDSTLSAKFIEVKRPMSGVTSINPCLNTRLSRHV